MAYENVYCLCMQNVLFIYLFFTSVRTACFTPHAQVVCERSNGVTITAGSHCTAMVNLQHNETVALCRE